MDRVPEDSYQPVLSSRYGQKSPLNHLFSERNKTEIWRQLWINLSEAENELGLEQVTSEMIEEMREQKTNIDWDFVRAEEKRIKHDVMAHNHAYGKVCPKAAGVIHLGATSCYVQDNADLIMQREALDLITKRLAVCIKRLGDFAEKYAELVCVGRTHYQAASLTTVGKRACLWAQELVMALECVVDFRENMRFRGIKGATGTQDSFLTLFAGDENLVEELDWLVTKKAGFTKKFNITGQTYSRQQDSKLLFALSNFGSVAHKICLDIRCLQAFDEIREPFEADQIGSSAMPYKRNPIKCERICGLARHLMGYVTESLGTLSVQGLERTLDDSSNRRVVIPQAFFTAEAILVTLQNVLEGLNVETTTISRNVEKELPFLALEKALMLLTKVGVSRQDAHAKIRETALKGKEMQDREKVTIENLLSEPFYDKVKTEVVTMCSNPLNFCGRCVSQTRTFLANELHPAIDKILGDTNDEKVSLDI
ncbi:lyase domain-containing protein [Ditylenchus destructor]|nr:lyase domain-containing protein [Ditylenchus destructor]